MNLIQKGIKTGQPQKQTIITVMIVLPCIVPTTSYKHNAHLHKSSPSSHHPDSDIKTTSHSTHYYKHVLISNMAAQKFPCLSMGTETQKELSLLLPHYTESMCRDPGNSFNILSRSVSNLVLDWRHHSSAVFSGSGCQWGRQSIHWPLDCGGGAAFVL